MRELQYKVLWKYNVDFNVKFDSQEKVLDIFKQGIVRENGRKCGNAGVCDIPGQSSF